MKLGDTFSDMVEFYVVPQRRGGWTQSSLWIPSLRYFMITAAQLAVG